MHRYCWLLLDQIGSLLFAVIRSDWILTVSCYWQLLYCLITLGCSSIFQAFALSEAGRSRRPIKIWSLLALPVLPSAEISHNLIKMTVLVRRKLEKHQTSRESVFSQAQSWSLLTLVKGESRGRSLRISAFFSSGLSLDKQEEFSNIFRD